jgi:hypothetical protein
LNDGSRVHLGCARRITDEARDTKAHVARVAERGEQNRGRADDDAGQYDPKIPFLHVCFPNPFFFEPNVFDLRGRLESSIEFGYTLT